MLVQEGYFKRINILKDLKLEGFILLASLSLSNGDMQDRKNIDIQTLMRYIEGIGSYDDSYMVKKWLLQTEPGDLLLYNKCLQFWDGISLNPGVKEYDGAHILDQIDHEIKIDKAVFLNKSNIFKMIKRYYAIFIIAASLSGLLFCY
jgi:hypothetical protein